LNLEEAYVGRNDFGKNSFSGEYPDKLNRKLKKFDALLEVIEWKNVT
jgi:hypothetical protein